jgi:hypothetical protein
MGYFNYHAKIRKLIEEHHLIEVQLVDNWNGIKPAMVLYFDNAKPMPIREHRFAEYEPIFKQLKIDVTVA